MQQIDKNCFLSLKPLLIIIVKPFIFAASKWFQMFTDDFGGFDENESHVAREDFMQFQGLLLKV